MRTCIRTAVAAIAAASILAGCSAGGPSANKSPEPTVSVEPMVTLHVPESASAGVPIELVIDSAGHDGEAAQLYAFSASYEQKADCADTTATSTPITLAGGPQKVSINAGVEGDTWLVLTGESFGTECGAEGSRLRVLSAYQPALQICAEGTSGTVCEDMPEAGIVRNANEEIIYRVTAKPERKLPVPAKVSVSWVGPFKTVPEAKATPCQETPVAATDQGELVEDPNTLGRIQTGWNRVVEEPGVYRVVLTLEGTDYTAPYEVTCESAPLVTIH